MKHKWFSICVIMILLSLFSACSKKETEPEEVITFKSAESETTVETPDVQNTEQPPAPIPVADTTAPADVKDLLASSGDGSVMLSWTNPADEDFTKIVITYGVDGTAVVRGVPGGMGKQYIADLKNGVEYTFTVMTVDKEGNVSEGTQVSSTPVSPKPVNPIETTVAKTEPEPVKTVEPETKQEPAPIVQAPIKQEPIAVTPAAEKQEPKEEPVETAAIPEPEPVEVASVPVQEPKEQPVETAAISEPEPVEIASVPVQEPKEEPVETAVIPEPEPVEVASVPVQEPEEQPVETAVISEPEPVEIASVPMQKPEEQPVETAVIPEPEPVEIASVPVQEPEEEPLETAFIPEPEPVVELFQSNKGNVFVPFIRSADGNIAENLDSVFQKTGEVSVLSKVTTIELNEQKSLVSAYKMSKYPVTQELFEVVMGTNPSKCVDSSSMYVTAEGEVTKLKPCEKISWYDAIAFCNKLSLLMEYEPCYSVSGIDDWASLTYEEIPVEYNEAWSAVSCDFTRNGFRLPTEREWEIAARGGNPEAEEWNYAFSGKDTAVREAFNADLDSVGWYRYNICNDGITASEEPAFGAGYGTHETGLKAPNSLSLYDMCGNVWEWCWDSCQTTDDNSTFTVDPVSGVPADSCRALRGGSWSIDAMCCDIPSRLIEYEFYRSARYGFRLVRTASNN